MRTNTCHVIVLRRVLVFGPAGLIRHKVDGFDQRKSLSPGLGFRERVSCSVFASRFHFFASIILSAVEISSKVGAFHRRTVQPPALAR